MTQGVRGTGYVFLCALPFLALGAVAARPLRTAGVAQVIGIVLFTAAVAAAWVVGARVVSVKEAGQKKFALAGVLLILPFAIISLLWVGIGPPFQATLSENYMRQLVLVWNSILVTSAFIVLKDALFEAGERFYSTVGFAAALIAGVTYLVCLNIDLAQFVVRLRGDQTLPPRVFVGDFYSALEFIACIMTYVTTLVFATALARVGFLGRGAARGYAAASGILVLLVVARGLQFPEISGRTPLWYMQPGTIAGIPAVPWIMPCLLGGVLLRRAGDAGPFETLSRGHRK